MTETNTTMSRSQAWIAAMRPRTLMLAIASISMGAFLAAARDVYRWEVVALCITTAVFLQILSNLANDYGDYVHGADATGREGPMRAVHSGRVTPRAMKLAMGVFALLAAVTGLALVLIALGPGALPLVLLFLVLGAAAIGAAVTYTAGNKPYGYAGLGDVAVLVFFGWVAVLGAYFLQARSLDWALVLPATSIGLLAVAVLNVNNIRDIESDAKAGKWSIPVRLGPRKARIYHWGLLITAVLCALIYVVLQYRSPWQWFFLLGIPLLIRNGLGVWRADKPGDVAPFLKQMAIATLVFVFVFGVGLVAGGR